MHQVLVFRLEPGVLGAERRQFAHVLDHFGDGSRRAAT